MKLIDPSSFLVIVVIAALAGVMRTSLERRVLVPVVAIELLLGILIGPQVASVASAGNTVSFFAELGLAMLFFFAGYEIDLDRIRGKPLELAAAAWALSLVLAFAVGGILAAAGIVLSLLYTGSAMATTAMGTLIPIAGDSGDLQTEFGGYLLAAGAIGEFGPIVLVTLFLSTSDPLGHAGLLLAFAVVAVAAGAVTVRSMWRGWPVLERTLETSSQLGVRLLMVLIFGLVALATRLGLDLLLGGFVAGVISRAALRGREVKVFDSKMTAIGYGFLIPFFFVVSGMKFDGSALFAQPSELLKVPMFVALFLIARGVPALVLYRRVMSLRDRLALAFYSSTQLPMVVAITTVALASGHMKAVTASALVGAGIVSTFLFPLAALRLRSREAEPVSVPAPEPDLVAASSGLGA